MVAFLTLLTKQIAGGTAPGQALLCTSRLTPLIKSDGGIRPIACGELIYRLVAKTLMRHYFRKTMLLPWQFGVGTPGGVEPVTRALEQALSDDLPLPYTHVTSLDFSNAFNSISRASVAAGLLHHAPSLFRAGKWAYNKPSQLVVLGEDRQPTILTSSEGVRQGDPLGPLFFSVGARRRQMAVQRRRRRWSVSPCMREGPFEDEERHHQRQASLLARLGRSEERRVGKECRSRWSPYH